MRAPADHEDVTFAQPVPTSPPERPASRAPARVWARRASLALAAAAALTGALECGPPTPITREHLVREVAQLDLPAPPTSTRWTWPGAAAFRDAQDIAAREAYPIRVITGRFSQKSGAWEENVAIALSREPGADTYEIRAEFANRAEWAYGVRIWPRKGWRLRAGSLDRASSHLEFEQGEGTLQIDADHISPHEIPELSAIADWSYVTTLLASDPPVYAAEVNTEDWEGVAEPRIKSAIDKGDPDAALELYRTHIPVGRCSQDDRPAQVAGEYADLCYSVGKLGCFLQLQIRIMGDQFERIAYSNIAEARADTHSERLLDTGVDADRFFLGLVVRFAGPPRLGELGTWRLARSIREAGRADALAPVLTRMAGDPDLDDYNRLRATQVLAHLERADGLDEDRLPPAVQDWLDVHHAAKAAHEAAKAKAAAAQ